MYVIHLIGKTSKDSGHLGVGHPIELVSKNLPHGVLGHPLEEAEPDVRCLLRVKLGYQVRHCVERNFCRCKPLPAGALLLFRIRLWRGFSERSR